MATWNESTSAVGLKAEGLQRLPAGWTPPFVVLAPSADGDEAGFAVAQQAVAALEQLAISAPDGFIVRPSSDLEDIAARGLFRSERCAATTAAVGEAGSLVIAHARETIGSGPSGLIVQAFVQPDLAGHMSNERRVSMRCTDWLVDVEQPEHLRGQARFATTLSDEPSAPTRSAALPLADPDGALRRVAQHLTSRVERFHCEWVLQGRRLWLVQADVERRLRGDTPGKAASAMVPGVARSYRVLRPAEDTDLAWPKAVSLKMMRKAGLTPPVVLALDDASLVEALAAGEEVPDLESDLNQLYEVPAVIRTDVLRDETTFMLPRSDAALDASGALAFLREAARSKMGEGFAADEIAFLLHRFLPARASAWTMGRPTHPVVRIDATWGLPDGLLWYAHDSFAVDRSGTGQIKKQRRCKDRLLDFDSSGAWFERFAGAPWDWKQAATESEVRRLAELTGQLVDAVGAPIETMFFVGVPETHSADPIVPWVITSNVRAAVDVRRASHFDPARVTIRNFADLDRLSREAGAMGAQAKKLSLQLLPEAELLRSDTFLETVIAVAQGLGCHIELEGSELSHAYYILSRSGVPLRVFEPFRSGARRERFDKLVRDRVPEAIRARGEVAETYRITGEGLQLLLRRKIVEEALEVLRASSNDAVASELGDLLEVAEALARSVDTSLSEIEAGARGKRDERGGFERGLVLVATAVPEWKDTPEPLFDLPQSDPPEISHVQRLPVPVSRSGNLTLPLIPPDLAATSEFRVAVSDELEAIVEYRAAEVRIAFRQIPPPLPEGQLTFDVS